MKEYNFLLKYQVPQDVNIDKALNALYKEGCDDALVGIGRTGYIALDFYREADSYLEAVASAKKDIAKAVPQAILVC